MDNFFGCNDGRRRCRSILHIVRPGDTLYKISRKYGVPLSWVMYANPYVDIYNMQPGDEICVPFVMPGCSCGCACRRNPCVCRGRERTENWNAQMLQDDMDDGMMMPERNAGMPVPGNGGMPASGSENGTGGSMAMPGNGGGRMAMPGNENGTGSGRMRVPGSENSTGGGMAMPGNENSMGSGRMPGNGGMPVPGSANDTGGRTVMPGNGGMAMPGYGSGRMTVPGNNGGMGSSRMTVPGSGMPMPGYGGMEDNGMNSGGMEDNGMNSGGMAVPDSRILPGRNGMLMPGGCMDSGMMTQDASVDVMPGGGRRIDENSILMPGSERYTDAGTMTGDSMMPRHTGYAGDGGMMTPGSSERAGGSMAMPGNSRMGGVMPSDERCRKNCHSSMMGFCQEQSCVKMEGAMPWQRGNVTEEMMDEYLSVNPQKKLLHG